MSNFESAVELWRAGHPANDAINFAETEIISLRKQVERMKAELTESEQARAYEIDIKCKFSSDLTVCEKQVEKLTKERDEAISLLNATLDVADAHALTIHESDTKIAALAEQNENMRKVLLRLACLGNGDQYGNSIGNCIAQEALSIPDLANSRENKLIAEDASRHLAALAEQNEKLKFALRKARWDSLNITLTDWDVLKQAANLPDLATPVLNRLRAEGMREAADICKGLHYLWSFGDDTSGPMDCFNAIRAKADELEQSK